MYNKLPLISVAMACYNGEPFITEQLDSILKQTYPNIEIIITDDCSQDDTKKIIHEYQLIYSNIFLFENRTNLGVTKTFEHSLSYCSGEFIALSDQDDIWVPEKLMTLYQSIEKKQLAYGDSELIDDLGKPINKKLSDLRKMYSGNNTKGFAFNNIVLGHAMLLNAQILKEALPIPNNIPHDIWLAYKACAIGGIHYCNNVLTKYRQHNKSVTTTMPQKAVARTKNNRYDDFENKLNWITVMEANAIPREKPFYMQLLLEYKKKQTGKFAWGLLLFMLKQRKDLFMFSKKHIASQVIEIFKQCRGEKYEIGFSHGIITTPIGASV